MSGWFRVLAAPVVISVLLGMPTVVAVQSSGDDRVMAGAEWPSADGDWTNSRHSRLTQIGTESVMKLGGAWVSQTFESGASSRSTPLIKAGLMFVTAGTGVYALNAKTGETVWTWRSDKDVDASGSDPTADFSAGAGGVVRVLNLGYALPAAAGVAVGEGLVFVGHTDGRVVALSQETGRWVWSQQIGEDPPQKGQTVTAPPVYANGIVFTGLANGDWMLRGRIVALEATTGRKLWTFFTIPGPGDLGHTTWPKGSNVWNRGGAGVWQPGAVDRDLGLVYWVTGNTVPEWGGEVRAGNNLFANSLLALEMKSGKLRWHYQLIHHDIWNADLRSPPLLYELQVGGRPRKAVAVLRTSLDGSLFIFDRETGEPLFPVEERRVPQDPMQKTAATQPFPIGADRLAPDCAPFRDALPLGFELNCDPFVPTSLGRDQILSMNFGAGGPMTYSPQTGFFYAHGSASLQQRRRISEDPWLQGSGDTGLDLLNLPQIGVLAAIDGRTNRIVWKNEVTPGMPPGRDGLLTTAGGLLFRRGGDGNIEAYDASTGTRLWQFQIGNPRAQGPAATYEIDGEQYLAMSWGRQIGAFKLGGTLPQRPAPKAATSAGGSGVPADDTTEIGTASVRQQTWGSTTNRYSMDEYRFTPLRARVRAGTRVTFVNNGRIQHTPAAQDGSWSTEPLSPEMQAHVTFNTPGTYLYVCKDHPFSIGQIVVVPPE